MSSFLNLIKAVDNAPYDDDFCTLYKLLLPADSRPHGLVLPSIVSTMPWSPDFAINHESLTVQLNDSSHGRDTAQACTAAFQKTIDVAIAKNLFPILHGEHSEMYKIMGANHFIRLERYTAPLFGIVTRGAHMTAFVRTSSGIKIWVPRRSAHLFTYPNKLDTTVAGGVKADHSPFDCIIAEAEEEASLPADFVRENVKATGIVSYLSKNGEGLLHPSVLYVFDIELPETIIPQPQDDEVSEFYLWDVEEVKQALLRQEFKSNCDLVMIDFFVRHGIISAENEKEYAEIVTRLRRRLPVPITPEFQKE